MENLIKKICFVLLLTTFSSVYGGDCFEDRDVDDCLVKEKLGDQQGQMAQFILGGAYYFGQGVPQNYKESIKWFKKSAEQGDAQAQIFLASMNMRGQGTPQDYKEAVKWYRLAAEQKEAQGQILLGIMYSEGLGVLKDYVMAHMYFNIAAASDGKKARELRDSIEKMMAQSQIAEAQKLAREWMRTH